jgi:tRNA-specific 2-thiouridylase
MDKNNVAVALSGGSDSAAALLKVIGQGYSCTGITLKLHDCFPDQNIQDAKQLCKSLGVKHYLIDAKKEFNQRVIRYFVESYEKGFTPNPCVKCNQWIKFGFLLLKIEQLGCKMIATGHYARLLKDRSGCRLFTGTDKNKDQSYFLAMLNQGQLKRIIFPLGDTTKEENRRLLLDNNICLNNLHKKAESQEICFIPDNDYAGFMEKYREKTYPVGDIVDEKGAVLGRHGGIIRYTIGQRRGTGIAAGYPVYVKAIDAKENRIIVSRKEDTLRNRFFVRGVNWIQKTSLPVEAEVKTRYQSRLSRAIVSKEGKSVCVTYTDERRTVTPGQLAVFYLKDEVLGGGWIED